MTFVKSCSSRWLSEPKVILDLVVGVCRRSLLLVALRWLSKLITEGDFSPSLLLEVVSEAHNWFVELVI